MLKPMNNWLQRHFKSMKKFYKVLKNPDETKGDSFESPEENHLLEESERGFVKALLHLKKKEVGELMIPRVDIVAFSVTAAQQEVLEKVIEQPFIAYPVYTRVLDDVIGVIFLKDVARSILNKTFDCRSLVEKVLFIPRSMHIFDLLMQMRASGTMIAMVVDEHGGIDGMITSWDIIKEILGSEDEEEAFGSAPRMIKLQDGSYIADARLPLEDFEEIFGDILTEEEKEEDLATLGGLITYLAGRVPDYKELISHSSGIEFEVLEANPRRVVRLKIRRALLA